MTYAAAIEKFLARQEEVTRTRVASAAMPWEKQFPMERWNRELASDLDAVRPSGRNAEVVAVLNSLLENQLRTAAGYPSSRERANAVTAIFADIRSRADAIAGELEGGLRTNALDPDAGRQMLYRLYDDIGRLLYVGVTNRGPARLVEHYNTKPWFPLVARIELERHPDRRSVLERERKQIQMLRPIHNIQHNGAVRA